MFCDQCGNQLPEGAVFCHGCGNLLNDTDCVENISPVPSVPIGYVTTPPSKSHKLIFLFRILGWISAILGIVAWCRGFTFGENPMFPLNLFLFGAIGVSMGFLMIRKDRRVEGGILIGCNSMLSILIVAILIVLKVVQH